MADLHKGRCKKKKKKNAKSEGHPTKTQGHMIMCLEKYNTANGTI